MLLDDRLAFVATGVLDALVGVPTVTEVSADAVTGVSLVGVFGGRIQIQSSNTRLTIACDSAADRFGSLLIWLATSAPGPVWLAGTPSECAREELFGALGAWASVPGIPREPELATPAVGVSASNEATNGWLLVTTRALIWLPSRSPAPGAHPVVLPIDTQAWVWDDDPDEVRVDLDASPYRWVTKGRRAFRAAFLRHAQQAKTRPEAVDDGLGNRRDSYRVEVLEQAQPPILARLLIDGKLQPLDCAITDLSLGGCGLRLHTELPAGTTLYIDVTESGRVRSANGRVINCRRLPLGNGELAGVVFENGAPGFDTAVRAIWMELQREQLCRLRGARPVTP